MLISGLKSTTSSSIPLTLPSSGNRTLPALTPSLLEKPPSQPPCPQAKSPLIDSLQPEGPFENAKATPLLTTPQDLATSLWYQTNICTHGHPYDHARCPSGQPLLDSPLPCEHPDY